MTPRLRSESACSSSPCNTQVTISMSRWGWVEKPLPARTRSSLLTISSPWPVFAGSQWLPKLKLWRLSSQSMLVWGRASARRTSMTGLVVTGRPPGSRMLLHMQLPALPVCSHAQLGHEAPVVAARDLEVVDGEHGHARVHQGVVQAQERAEVAVSPAVVGPRGAEPLAPVLVGVGQPEVEEVPERRVPAGGVEVTGRHEGLIEVLAGQGTQGGQVAGPAGAIPATGRLRVHADDAHPPAADVDLDRRGEE